MIPYFDAHCDTIYRLDDLSRRGREETLRENSGHVDLQRNAAFSPRAQFFALYGDAAQIPAGQHWQFCQRLHHRYCREVEENRDLVTHCATGAEVDAAVAAVKSAALLSIEGADLLDCDARRIPEVAAWGVRLLNPVWNRANVLSGTNCEDPGRGLSAQGRDFIRVLEEHHIYPDVSHLSDPGFWDLMKIARRPVVASHSNSRTLCAHRRNLTDDMFKAIRDSGGVVGINLYTDFVGPVEAGQAEKTDQILRHIEHFLLLDGEKTICFGGDLDGCESLAGGINGVQDIPELYAAMARRGYDESLLYDIFWGNLRRIL